jgi:glycosyltransferase involved in cell wall biosynthesis
VSRNGRPLRLVEVGLRWPPETFLRRKLESLAAEGFEVRAASVVPQGRRPAPVDGIGLEPLPHWAETGVRAWLSLGLEALALLVRDPARFRRLLPALSRAGNLSRRRLYVRLARLRADVFHVEWLGFAEACAPVFDVWRAPVVLSCHGRDLHCDPHIESRAPLARTLPELFRRASAVHCVSDFLRREAVARGLDPGKARVITPAVDSGFFRPAGDARVPDGRFRLVCVGWFRWLKGWEYALLAVAELVRAGVPVSAAIVGGDPPGDPTATERKRIQYTIGDLGLSRHVELHGHARPDELRAQLQRADAFLHASLVEGLPNVVLEAMACGLPVVATDVGATREAVTDGVEGLLVPPRDPAAAAVALARLWREPQLRLRLGAAGRARVEREFGLGEQTRRYRALYEDVLARA